MLPVPPVLESQRHGHPTCKGSVSPCVTAAEVQHAVLPHLARPPPNAARSSLYCLDKLTKAVPSSGAQSRVPEPAPPRGAQERVRPRGAQRVQHRHHLHPERPDQQDVGDDHVDLVSTAAVAETEQKERGGDGERRGETDKVARPGVDHGGLGVEDVVQQGELQLRERPHAPAVLLPERPEHLQGVVLGVFLQPGIHGGALGDVEHVMCLAQVSFFLVDGGVLARQAVVPVVDVVVPGGGRFLRERATDAALVAAPDRRHLLPVLGDADGPHQEGGQNKEGVASSGRRPREMYVEDVGDR
uniref:Uncharacterized protein n=1 Tax=Zea mays TaxID=4577 RepID=B4FWQ5_MAIZE|nr:unknown [Zea mays]